MTSAVLFSFLLLMVCVFIHYEVLKLLKRGLDRAAFIPRRAKLLVVIFGAMFSHLLHIACFGAAYYLLRDKFGLGTFGGTFSDTFSSFLYFSAETYTTLGFGDIYPAGAIRMLAGIEALTGLVLVGWTVSFTYLEMTRFWSDGPGR